VISLLKLGFTNNRREKKELTNTTDIEQEQSQEGYVDPYSIFKYAMNSPVTRDRYTTRLDRFFAFIGLEGVNIEDRCAAFVQHAKKDDGWAFRKIVNFLQVQKERVDRKEITGSYLEFIDSIIEKSSVIDNYYYYL
jgi:hypothetical protein